MFIMNAWRRYGPGVANIQHWKITSELFDNAEDKVKTNFNDVAGLEEQKLKLEK
jgi:ATP-dependent Zn protease